MLERLDQFFAVAGGVVLVAWGWRFFKEPAGVPLQPPIDVREDAVLLVMLVYFGAALTLSAAMKAVLPPDDVLAWLVVNGGAQMCGVAACLFVVSRRLGGMKSFLVGRSTNPTRPETIAFYVLGSIIVAIGICPLIRDVTAWLIHQQWPDFQFETHPTLAALEKEGVSPIKIVVLWFGAAAIAPVAEEFFFRGFLQNFLWSAAGRAGAAMALSALAFAAVHFSQVHALPALFFLGLILGWGYARTGGLYVPVAVHAAFNLKTLVWEALS